jgi:hypothetical protein
MKRKRTDRPNWRRVTKRRFAMEHLETEVFRGYVSLICIDEVSEPLTALPIMVITGCSSFPRGRAMH